MSLLECPSQQCKARFRLKIQSLLVFGLLICLQGLTILPAQPTLGLLQKDSTSFDGYTLFAPVFSDTTYLIDNCGRKRNAWRSAYLPGLAAFLLPDGDLLRTARLSQAVFAGGGIGGRIERFDWDGNLKWWFQYADSTVHQHHDIRMLPNGNLLVLAWEAMSEAEALSRGRNPALLTKDGLWPDHLIEISPDSGHGGTIVWEWHVRDHLIQDFDSSKADFGDPARFPERIDLNYTGVFGDQADWTHCNAVAYHPGLDQIVITSRNFSECWVIDHSTTSAEAAGHSGGRYGKGGDLLYRWGNPAAYGRGTVVDQILFQPHDAQWIADSLWGGGDILIYNNGPGRPAGNYSSIEQISPPYDSAGGYLLSFSRPFGPVTPSWQYVAPDTFSFYSANISGMERLPGGNTLICEGAPGRFFEVDSGGTVVWEYLNPVGQGGPFAQGSMPRGNNVFRCNRYAPAYGAFQGRALMPGLPVERNPLPLPEDCDPVGLEVGKEAVLRYWPNPVEGVLWVEWWPAGGRQVGGEGPWLEVLDLQGRLLRRWPLIPGRQRFVPDGLEPGLVLIIAGGRFWGKLVILPGD